MKQKERLQRKINELKEEKKLLKIAYRYNGRCDSFVDVETVRRLREASEKFKKSYEAYLIAKNNLKKARHIVHFLHKNTKII